MPAHAFRALRSRRDQRGVALFAAVAAMLVLSTMIVALVVLAKNEVQISQLTKDEAQAAYAAEAGANWGRRVLVQRLRTDLPTRVALTSRAAMRTALTGTYNSYAGGAQFLVDYALPASGPTFALCSSSGGCPEPNYSAVGAIADTQQVVLNLVCPGTAGCPANLAFDTRVIVGTHPTIPPAIMSGGTGALFTYVWRVESSGTSGRARQQWVIHDSSVPTNQVGSFTIALNADFVRYAHFIDQFQDAGGGGNPWISYRHVYTGPVHTNTRFSILGNISTPGQEGPTFRSEATQTQTQTRFNNSGSPTNQSRDSTANDWPLLGPDPGILCKSVDCSGFTRSFDYDPTTPALDPIPFPGGSNPQDRMTQICMARGVASGSCPTTVASLPALCTGTGPLEVVVSNNCTGGTPQTLNGGIWVTKNVTDLLLGNVENVGQSIVIYYSSADGQARRTVIREDRTTSPKTTLVVRQCRKSTNTAGAACAAGGSVWNDDPTRSPNRQTFNDVFSPSPATDYGMLFVNGTIGVVDTSNGLRRGVAVDNTSSGVGTTAYAIYQNTGVTSADKADGSRLTVAAEGNVWITGNLNYRIDPRGPDGIFSDPIPGDPTGTSADDQMDVQNVLGVLSWGTTGAGGIRLSSALTGNLDTHGMVFVANLNGNSAPSGQFSFDDWTGSYRGISTVLGGVVQKTMGTFGQPSSNTGYERNWIYDERFRYKAMSPPAFPGFPNFSAATSLGIDSFSWRLGLF